MTTEHKPHSSAVAWARKWVEDVSNDPDLQLTKLCMALISLEEQLEAVTRVAEAAKTYRDVRGDYTWVQMIQALDAWEHSNPASEPLVTDENLAARVQQVQHLMDKGDEAELIAYMLGRPVEDVRRVVGSPASEPNSA